MGSFVRMGDEVLRGVTFADGSTGDVRLRADRIAAVGDVGRRPRRRRARPRRSRPADRGGRAARPPRQGVPRRALGEPDRRSAWGHLGDDRGPAAARRRRHRRACRAGGPPDGPQRLPCRAHPRRHHAGQPALQRRGTRRGPSPRRRRDRCRDRRPVRLADHRVRRRRPTGPAPRRTGSRSRPRRRLPAPRRWWHPRGDRSVPHHRRRPRRRCRPAHRRDPRRVRARGSPTSLPPSPRPGSTYR